MFGSCRHADESGAGAKSCLAGEADSPTHAQIAADRQHMSKITFVRIRRARRQRRGDHIGFEQAGIRRRVGKHGRGNRQVVERDLTAVIPRGTGVQAALAGDERDRGGRLDRAARDIAGIRIDA